MVSSTDCMSVDKVAIRRRISLVAVCSRSRDSSCSVTRGNCFLSWLSSVARGLFFFFVIPSRAIWDLRVLFGGLSAVNYEKEIDETMRRCWLCFESLLDHELRCQPCRNLLWKFVLVCRARTNTLAPQLCWLLSLPFESLLCGCQAHYTRDLFFSFFSLTFLL